MKTFNHVLSYLFKLLLLIPCTQRSTWSWSYDSCKYNYLCNKFLSPLTLWVRILLTRGVLDTTLCDKVCQWLAACRWFSTGTPVSSINKTDLHDIIEQLLKVTLNTITLTSKYTYVYYCLHEPIRQKQKQLSSKLSCMWYMHFYLPFCKQIKLI